MTKVSPETIIERRDATAALPEHTTLQQPPLPRLISGVEETRRGLRHVMVDGYDGNKHKMGQMANMYGMMRDVLSALKLETLDLPHVIPYFNGKIPMDSGVSGTIIYEGGHMAVHTFNKKETVFADVAYDDQTGEDPMPILREAIRATYDPKRIDEFVRGQNQVADPSVIPESFGPHVTFQGALHFTQDTVDWIYEFLKSIPAAIDMTPISNPSVRSTKGVKDGMIVIAESHITIHSDKDRNYYFDIFSCKEFDINKFFEFAESRGLQIDKSSVVLAVRGKDFPR
ncbi:MAG: S-adenosylmethionine decarboxylase [Candidatus Peregrinibacteria bacterium]|nr:S-adenosylmethionine decarboxylase [Candidatus Peregrinibacteria bacterium]